MNGRFLLAVLSIVSVWVTSELNGSEQEQAPKSLQAAVARDIDLRTLLEAGKAANSLPSGVTVRVTADLFGHRADADKKLKQAWEFTADHVHQVVYNPPEKSGDKGVYRRVESVTFDSKNLCKDLLVGKVFAIEAEQGTGDIVLFAGTDYRLGERSIEILVGGQSALLLCEACTGPVYAETDARAFAALHEQLAAQARAAFQAKPK